MSCYPVPEEITSVCMDYLVVDAVPPNWSLIAQFSITGNKQGKSPHFGPEWRFLPGFFIASTSSYEDNSLGNRTGNKIAGNRDLFELKQGSDRHFREVGKTGLNAEVR